MEALNKEARVGVTPLLTAASARSSTTSAGVEAPEARRAVADTSLSALASSSSSSSSSSSIGPGSSTPASASISRDELAKFQDGVSAVTDMNERVISQNILLQAELENLMRLNVELRNEKATLAMQLRKMQTTS